MIDSAVKGGVVGAILGVQKCTQDWWLGRRQIRQLEIMLNDPRFPKGFRSIGQLSSGIRQSPERTVELLLKLGARKSEISDEWTLKKWPPSKKS